MDVELVDLTRDGLHQLCETKYGESTIVSFPLNRSLLSLAFLSSQCRLIAHLDSNIRQSRITCSHCMTCPSFIHIVAQYRLKVECVEDFLVASSSTIEIALQSPLDSPTLEC